MPGGGFWRVKNDFARYISGEINAVKDEFILSREKAPRGSELIHVTHTESQSAVYEFWTSTSEGQRRGKAPKHTGGKKPYVMLMVERLIVLLASGLPIEHIGYLVCLSAHIEWGTGKLVTGRTKRRMKFIDIQKVFHCGYKKTQAILAGLKEYNLIAYTKEGYFVSRDLIKKGSMKRNAVEISEGDDPRKDS